MDRDIDYLYMLGFRRNLNHFCIRFDIIDLNKFVRFRMIHLYYKLFYMCHEHIFHQPNNYHHCDILVGTNIHNKNDLVDNHLLLNNLLVDIYKKYLDRLLNDLDKRMHEHDYALNNLHLFHMLLDRHKDQYIFD